MLERQGKHGIVRERLDSRESFVGQKPIQIEIIKVVICDCIWSSSMKQVFEKMEKVGCREDEDKQAAIVEQAYCNRMTVSCLKFEEE